MKVKVQVFWLGHFTRSKIKSESIFKASALWADAFYKSICPSVRLSVCLFVCLSVCSLFAVPFNGLFAPTSRSQMSNIFRDLESLGKVMERSGLRYEYFRLKIVENRITKKSFFSPLYSLFLVFFGFRSFLTVFLPPLPEVRSPIL